MKVTKKLTPVKKLMLISLMFFLALTSCENEMIGKYKKEPLPSDFSYRIIEDKSNEKLDKNELLVEINQKLSKGQIATLAEKLFNSKPKRKRFYIFYLLKGMKKNAGAWAISHFDPELKIEILGSTIQQDKNMNKTINDKIEGEIVGKWKEEQYTSAIYIIYKKNSRTFVKTIYKNGQTSDEELLERKIKNGIRYDFKNGGYNGEYFILKPSGELEFYNNKNKRFTIANKIK